MGYALNLLRKIPYLERVVGIATEGELRRVLRSEDLIYAEQPEWTPNAIAEVEKMASGMEIFTKGFPSDDNLTLMRPFEYPPSHHPRGSASPVPYHFVAEPGDSPNRKQRRAANSKRRNRSY